MGENTVCVLLPVKVQMIISGFFLDSDCSSDLQVGYLGWLIDFSDVGVSLVASAFSIFLFRSSGL